MLKSIKFKEVLKVSASADNEGGLKIPYSIDLNLGKKSKILAIS